LEGKIMLKTVPQLIKDVREKTRSITADKAYQQVTSALFIDVREHSEVQESTIAGSINIPRGILEMSITKYCDDENQEIILHCASGGRASLAAEQLQRIGYNNVWAITCAHQKVAEAQKQLS
jgi:rhodanese-related sulfurtransferase